MTPPLQLEFELLGEVQAEANQVGAEAGAGLASAFAQGISSNSAQIINAVRAVLEEVRGMLPSSDAKWGPLSDITHSGRMLLRTFAAGAKNETPNFERLMAKNFEDAIPEFVRSGPLANLEIHPSATAPQGPMIGQLNVDGRSERVSGPMDLNAKHLVEAVQREISMQNRMR